MKSYASGNVFMAGLGFWSGWRKLCWNWDFCVPIWMTSKSGRFECGWGWWPSFWAVREVVEMCLFEFWEAVAIIFEWWGEGSGHQLARENVKNEKKKEKKDCILYLFVYSFVCLFSFSLFLFSLMPSFISFFLRR